MPMENHLAILINNQTNKKDLVDHLQANSFFLDLEKENLEYAYFSDYKINEIIAEEDRYQKTLIGSRPLITYSSGERKKLFLNHILKQKPAVLILDNSLDHLDKESRKKFSIQLKEISSDIHLIQLSSRAADLLGFINDKVTLNTDFTFSSYNPITKNTKKVYNMPESHIERQTKEELIRMEDIAISYDGKPVVKNIDWTIKSGDFWQLIGPNGSGKSSLLALITGDSTKGYGQELYLFGNKKGSGESVWEIKQKIGYFAPSMTALFSRSNTLLEMILSGYYDSVGLYDKPSSFQIKQAKNWLNQTNLIEFQHENFNKLSQGQQRLGLIIRAIVKNPPLLILDEPTDGLDDNSAALVIDFINKLKDLTPTAIIFVSHRVEPGLNPRATLQLIPSTEGSYGKIEFGKRLSK